MARFVTYSHGQATSWGVVRGDRVVDGPALLQRSGSPACLDALSVVRAGSAVWTALDGNSVAAGECFA